MMVCNACGGCIEELGEIPDYNNPCTCITDNLKKKIQELEQEKAELIKKYTNDFGDACAKIIKLEQEKAELEKLSISRWKIISELQQENKYLVDQNKAFQEQYCTSGDIIRKLRQEKAELIECLENFVNDRDGFGNMNEAITLLIKTKNTRL